MFPRRFIENQSNYELVWRDFFNAFNVELINNRRKQFSRGPIRIPAGPTFLHCKFSARKCN